MADIVGAVVVSNLILSTDMILMWLRHKRKFTQISNGAANNPGELRIYLKENEPEKSYIMEKLTEYTEIRKDVT